MLFHPQLLTKQGMRLVYQGKPLGKASPTLTLLFWGKREPDALGRRGHLHMVTRGHSDHTLPVCTAEPETQPHVPQEYESVLPRAGWAGDPAQGGGGGACGLDCRILNFETHFTPRVLGKRLWAGRLSLSLSPLPSCSLSHTQYINLQNCFKGHSILVLTEVRTVQWSLFSYFSPYFWTFHREHIGYYLYNGGEKENLPLTHPPTHVDRSHEHPAFRIGSEACQDMREHLAD